MCPTNPQIQCSVLFWHAPKAVTIESQQQVSQYRRALPLDTSYHISAHCRMLCRVLSSTTQSNSLYSEWREMEIKKSVRERMGGWVGWGYRDVRLPTQGFLDGQCDSAIGLA
jgi:hypothetical protein